LGNIGSIVELLTVTNEDDENGNGPKLSKEVVWSFLYLIWSQRNQLVFKSDRKKLEDLFFGFQRTAFEWISTRLHRKRLDWNAWLADPRVAVL